MKQYCGLTLLFVIWVITGCEMPQSVNPISTSPSTAGLKVYDLKDNSKMADEQSLMKFRVLTYTVVPDSIDKLKKVFDSLSCKNVRQANQKAFQANGFAIGTADNKQAIQIARKLSLMGATRAANAQLMFPPDSQEFLSQKFLQPTEVVHYAESLNSAATISQIQGFLGWVFSARPDKRYRGKALVKLFPAIWQPGIEDIRLVMGKEPIDYHPIAAGQVLARVEEGGIIVLGPTRSMPDETTLDKKLFFLPGRKPKIQFFIIICDSVGN
jgi:hypothetical protein